MREKRRDREVMEKLVFFGIEFIGACYRAWHEMRHWHGLSICLTLHIRWWFARMVWITGMDHLEIQLAVTLSKIYASLPAISTFVKLLFSFPNFIWSEKRSLHQTHIKSMKNLIVSLTSIGDKHVERALLNKSDDRSLYDSKLRILTLVSDITSFNPIAMISK